MITYPTASACVALVVGLAISSSAAAGSSDARLTSPALQVQSDGHWTLDSDGFKSPNRFFRSGVFGSAYEEALLIDADGFGVGFEDPEGKAMRSVRRDYQLIGNYMITAPVDRESTMMIGRRNDVEMDWDGNCIKAVLGDMTARSCFENLTITWFDATVGFMPEDSWSEFASDLCLGGAYQIIDGSCPVGSDSFNLTLTPKSKDRSFRSLTLSSSDGQSVFELTHNIRPAGVEPDKVRIMRRDKTGNWSELTTDETRALIESVGN